MKLFISFVFLFVNTLAISPEFYDMNSIQTIEINFEQSNWDQLLDAEKAGDENYILAQSVIINGTVFDSVGVKYKGNSTYSSNQVKNPFHIELDTYKEQDYQGYKDIKLSNVAKDPSFLREVLSYQILRQYMDAPLCNYSNVYVNGALLGLYSNAEAITKTFVKDRFYSKNNTFVKCNPPAGAGPQSNDFPNLEYLGLDSTDYYAAYELKSDDGWDELINLCDTLENNIDDIDKILDIDRTLWMLAFNNVTVNLDSYNGAFAQNYYLYKTDNGRFVPIIWDLNESFGQFANTGSGRLSNTTAKQQMSPFLHEDNLSYPLIRNLLNVPTYRRMYLAHCKTILLENFDNQSYLETGQNFQALIDAAVQADNNKFFTYNNFLDNLTADVTTGGGPGGGTTPGISALMAGRATYLLGLSEFTVTAPEIRDITLSSTAPVVGETITMTADVTDATTVFLGQRNDIESIFSRVQMYDDGQHNDGAANDGVYGVDLLIDNTFIQYYIYAENDNAGIFSPQRAEHEYYTINSNVISSPEGTVVINELMAANDQTIVDQDGEYDDWIELYNTSSSDVDLSGYYLSDDADELTQWTFPAGSTIAAEGYLMIWADKDEDQDGLHANFKLSSGGESLYFSDPNETILDAVDFLEQTTDISYGRYPNGTGDFRAMNATFGAENEGVNAIIDVNLEQTLFTLYPNPTTSTFQINLGALEQQYMQIYNLSGKKIYSDVIAQNDTIDCTRWTAGVYIIRIGNSYQRLIKG